MKAFGKILGLVLLGLLLLVIGLGFALTHFFDPNDYKEEIRQLARDKANLELAINGEIGWSLFPWLGLELHQTSLASAATPEQPFADLRMLGLSVRVLPLLRREVQMSDIRIDGLALILRRDEQGRGNWENIGKPAGAPATEPAAEPRGNEADSTGARSGMPIKLDIDSLTVNDARITYQDAQSGQQFSAESIQLETGAIREGSAIPVKLTAFFGSNQPLMRARSEILGELRFDLGQKRYQFEKFRLSGEASGEPLAGKTLNFSAQGELLADLDAQIAEWTGLKFSANQLRGLGDIKVRELDREPRISGGLSVASFNLRDFLAGLGRELPTTADANALSRVEMATRLNGSPTSFALEELTLKVDDTILTGRIAVEDFARQALRLQLKGDRLDISRYLPPKATDGASAARQSEVQETAQAASAGDSPLPAAPTRHAWSDAPVLPMDALRLLDVQATVGFDELLFDDHPFTNLDLNAQSREGLLALQTLRGNVYDARFEANGKVDVRQALPQLSIEAQLGKLPIEKFVKLEKQESPVQGLLDLTATLTTRGNSQKTWVDNLNGKANFLLSDGLLVGADLEHYLCRAVATLNRKSLTRTSTKDTPFEALRGSLQITNGVARNPDFKASVPGLTVNGNGTLDLRVLGLDYLIGIIIEGDKRAMPDPACQVNERYVGLEWPLRCRGPLELGAKTCRIDQDGLGKITAKLAGEKLTEKLDEKLGDKVSPELKDALKGLFKR
ncbi:AsmA family protein [Pseudomonas flexibilis]|uniref:Cell envelope biogenesis protein AsmA n=1 Tax=Pseudomonas flexibilis TaxID=706570 RepID=A0A0B3BZF0_9PSED|nr:AsmA family protein [Pseudomonas flexibilis]KHO64702.1 cell envelope biogenesis protein AsmA [Pseudomonas flexibilis]SCX99327.1 AsmA protein [Pseudomonas flexibilis]